MFTAHALSDCPFFSFKIWYLYIKISLLIPSLNPAWHRCIPTPWGVIVRTQRGVLLIIQDSSVYMNFRYDSFRFTLTEEVTTQAVRTANEHGATQVMLACLLGSLLTTWHKIDHINCVPILPDYPDFVMPRNPYGMVAHILTHPERMPDEWIPWDADVIVWPSPPLLYQLSHAFSLNVSLPHLRMSAPDLSPTLYWYMTQITGKWPETSVGTPSVAFLDAPKPLRLEGIFQGMKYWELEYGYPEHTRFLLCLNKDTNRSFVS